MKRTLPSSSFAFLVTALLCGPGYLFAANKPEIDFKQKNSKGGFIENKGQIVDQNRNPNPAVVYLLNLPGMNVQIRRGGFSYDLYQECGNAGKQNAGINSQNPESRTQNLRSSIQHPASSIQFHRIDIDLLNSNPNPSIETSAPSAGYFNYYTAGTPTEGVMNVRSFSTITYKNIYPGIDLQFISDERQFEYNFILQPGGDINAIKLKINGPQKIKRFREGFRCKTSFGDVDETIPVCYYTLNGTRIPVKGRFKKITEHLYGFAVDKIIPSDAVLLIDPIPTRRWGTYYGGSSQDWVFEKGGAIDNEGNLFICGYTNSTNNIATAGAFQSFNSGFTDGFLGKFSASGQLIWGTYYGGTLATAAHSCTTDANGNIFLVGITAAINNIATAGAYQTVKNGNEDGFIAKFTTNGSRLWGTYYGGHETGAPDSFEAVSADDNGNIYCAGITSSPDEISSPGAEQPTYGGGMLDAFLVKFTGDGQRVWGTYYGGTSGEDYACCSFGNGYVYLSGSTYSPNNIATAGSFMPNYNGFHKAFLACFDPDGNRSWGTYFGGESTESGFGCTTDTLNHVYLYGYTGSLTNISTPGVFMTNRTFSDAGFLEKFSSTGTRLWGTYYPSYIHGAAVDDSGFVFVAGEALVPNPLIASAGAYQTTFRGIYEAFLGKMTDSGQRIWGTYYGGTDQDFGKGCVVDHSDNVYLYGVTYSDNNTDNNVSPCTRNPLANYIASPGSHQPEYDGGDGDAYLVKFADCWSPDTALQINGPAFLCMNSTGNTFSIPPIATATDYTWCVTGDLTITSGQHTTSITVDAGPALGWDTISVYGINSCDTGFPKVITRRVHQRPVPSIAGNDTTCTGVTNLFTTAGGKTNYQWTVSTGGSITLGGTATDSTCSVSWNTAGANWIKVNYTDTSGCEALNPTQFNVWVVGGPTVSVSISALNNVCAGTSVTFTATPINGGSTPGYQWKVNGVNSGTNSDTFIYTPLNNDIVSCVLTSSLTGCVSGNPATSNEITMVVNPNLPVNVTIAPSQNPACAGNSITFTATPIFGGTTPSYQWKVNGINAGANNQFFTYIPLNGDLVTCTLNSSETCTTNNPALSNQVLMVMDSILVVGVTISPSLNPFCAGSPVTFSATPSNGGASPSYQWKVNGINAGPNSNVYSFVPNNGDQVSCVLTSSIPCPIANPITSNTLLMTVNNSLPAGVSITATSNPFCPGTSVTFTATPSNGGTPVYQWKVNGINVGTNSITYSYTPVNNDSVRCIMTSNLACVTGNPASSNTIIMSGTLAPIVTFTSCFDTITTTNAKPIKLKGGIPLGGTYSGTGVSAGYYYPNIAGIGTHVITYSYTNVSLCTASKNSRIHQFASSPVNCGSPFADIRDNHVYQTIQIGTQCWLATNLNFGTTIASTQDQRDNCISEKYCYNDNPLNCTNLGGLYQWDEVMRFDETPADQGFCPPAWHIPTENDWNTLFAVFINNAFAGSPLKYSGYSGFNALLSGARHINRSWDYQGFATFFWSSTARSDNKAWAHGLNDVDPSVSIYPASRVNAFSVRCLKD